MDNPVDKSDRDNSEETEETKNQQNYSLRTVIQINKTDILSTVSVFSLIFNNHQNTSLK